MMRKHVSRLLALVLVLCMVVLCVPVRAQADVDMTRPDGLTDEQWEVELQKRRAKALEEAMAAAGNEQDALSSSDGNLTVTDQLRTVILHMTVRCNIKRITVVNPPL